MSNLPLLYLVRSDFRIRSFQSALSDTSIGPTSKSKQGRLNFAAFQSKQRLFAVQAACVAGQLAITADDAVAGNQDGHFVLPVGGGNGADGFRIVQTLRLLFVAARFAVRNRQERIPCLLLKFSANLLQRRGKGFQTTLEV